MVPEMKLIITENGVPKQTVTKNIEGNLYKSLEEFRIKANDMLTMMIEEYGDSSDVRMEEIEEVESSSDDEADMVQKSKKKRK